MATTMPNQPPHDAPADAAPDGTALWHTGLKRQAIREAAGHWGALLVFFGILHTTAADRSTIPGAVCAVVVLAAVHVLLGYRLTESRRSGEARAATRLGTANRLTLLRGLLVSLTAGFLVIDAGSGTLTNLVLWLPGLLYLTAAVLDGVDGAWARRTGTQSALGKALDGDLDALGVLVACSVAVGSGRLPVYYLAAGLVYYGYQLSLWRRRRRGRPLHPPPPRRFARLVAGFQMAFLALALLPVVSTSALNVVAPFFLLPLLAGFAWDWVHVTGRFDDRLARRWRGVGAFLAAAGPAAMRIVILGSVVGLFGWAWRDVSPAAVVAAIGLWGWPQWLLFVAVNLTILGAMCWRWWLILKRLGHPVRLAALVPYRMAANTLSYITPGPQFGGEPLQVLCLTSRHGVPREAASAAVAVDRLTELMGTLVFLAVCGVLLLPPLMNDTVALMASTGGMVLVFLACGLLLHGVARGRAPLSRLAARVSGRRRLAAVNGLISSLEVGERRAATILTGGLAGWYGGIGLVQLLAFLTELWLIYAFLGFAMPLEGLLTAAVAARLAFLLPLPGGLGALEAGQMLALSVLGGDPSLGAAACAVMRLRDLVLISTGGIWALRWLRPFPAQGPPPSLNIE